MALDRGIEMHNLQNRLALLTPRERQVMALVVSGLLNKQVGGELGISEITVKGHRGQVMQKMKAGSVADLVRMAAKLRPLQADQKGVKAFDRDPIEELV
jgi:FixJ family two-component response regulator